MKTQEELLKEMNEDRQIDERWLRIREIKNDESFLFNAELLMREHPRIEERAVFDFAHQVALRLLKTNIKLLKQAEACR